MSTRIPHNAFSSMGSNGKNGQNGKGGNDNQDLLSQIVNNAVLSVISPVELENEIYICECGNCPQDMHGSKEAKELLEAGPQMPLYFIERRANGGTLLLDEADVSHNTVTAGFEDRKPATDYSEAANKDASTDGEDAFSDDFDPFDPKVSDSDIENAKSDLDLNLD